MLKKISVIIPIYNAEKDIYNCVESIINQDYTNIEIILVNDGSKDNSLQICNSIAEKHSNVIVIDKENEGCFSARNVGLKKATGSYIAFVDSDDYILPMMYKELVKILEDTNSDIVCCGRYRNINNKNDFSKMNITDNRIFEFSGVDATKHLFSDTTMIKPAVWDKLYKKEIFSLEKFSNTFFEDADLTYKLLIKANKVAVTRKQFYAYSVRKGTKTTIPWNMIKTKSYIEITNNAIKFLKENNIELVQYAYYWLIQFGIEAYERCLMSNYDTKEDLNLIKKNVKSYYYKLKFSKISMSFNKKVKKIFEFFIFRYFPGILCKLKKKELI